ncbi:unnamed protein product, partial [Ectocarpus fasciculatus]
RFAPRKVPKCRWAPSERSSPRRCRERPRPGGGETAWRTAATRRPRRTRPERRSWRRGVPRLAERRRQSLAWRSSAASKPS